MTARSDDARPSRRRTTLLSRLRRAIQLLRTVDLDEVFDTFEARQRKLEQAQRAVEAVLAETQSTIATLRQRPDPVAVETGLLDIKNLGYEIGRHLAERTLLQRNVEADYASLASKLCTQNDFATDWFAYWCKELKTFPVYHRKVWELCYVAQALFADGQLVAGRRGIGFGCGEEPLPSLFAKYGVRVTATDLEASRPEAQVWRQTAQHAGMIETIRRPEICPDPELLANIEFRPADMNAITEEFYEQYDFCWSTCALEHLGSLEKGLTFVENSLRTLKPGGLAVHTTEFTLSKGQTIDNHPIVLYQRRHLEELANRLHAQGYKVSDFDFSAGDGIMDRFIDIPPYYDRDNSLFPLYHSAHLKLLFDGHVCTSVGIIIKR